MRRNSRGKYVGKESEFSVQVDKGYEPDDLGDLEGDESWYPFGNTS